MREAQRWNFRTKKYEVYKLPQYASIHETDLTMIVACASCGARLLYGQCLTSRRIHTAVGFGYAVCEECYTDERDLELSYREENK